MSNWNKSSGLHIIKNPQHVADVHTNTPWIPQPQVDDICAIAERPYQDWIQAELKHVSDRWEKKNLREAAYSWQFRSLMRCVEIHEDGMAIVSVSGTRKCLPVMCLWNMTKTVDIDTNSVYDGF